MLVRTREKRTLSDIAFTFALMTIMKQNDMAYRYINADNFAWLAGILSNECQKDAQVAYQTTVLLWILSFHGDEEGHSSHHFFGDFNLEILEKTSKVLDFHNKEKIVRIFLKLVDNLKDVPVCEEHMSDIDAYALICKLENRYWVDPDVNKNLADLKQYFEEHQKEFSSIEKFKAQVERRQLKWGPCHTEEFWK